MDPDKRKEIANIYGKAKGKSAQSISRKGSKRVAVRSFKIKPAETVIQKNYMFSVGHEFLKNIRVLFKWATSTHNLSRQEVELLLYLYPEGMFTRADVVDFVRTLGIFGDSKFNKLKDEGWIEKFYSPHRTLYVLSSKGKKLSKDLHLMLLGDRKIPMRGAKNHLVKKENKVDEYYLKLLKSMNEDYKSKKEEKGK